MSHFLESIGYNAWILHALIVLPLIGVVPVLLGDERSAKHTALFVTTLEFILSIGLWWSLDPAGPPMQLISNAPWIPNWGISYRVGLDGISLVMVLLTTALMPLSVLASYRYITFRERGFYALMLTLLTGLVGVFLALDLFVFYIFFEVMLIPMYFIIGIWGGANRLYAAIKFFIYTMAGSLLMLVAIVVWCGRCNRRRAISPSPTSICWRTRAPSASLLPGSSPPSRSRSRSRSRSSLPYLASRRTRRGANGGQRTAGRRHAQDRDLRISALRRPLLPSGGAEPGGEPANGDPGCHRDHLRRARRIGPAGHQEAGGLLLGESSRLRHAGHLGRHDAERAGRAHGDDQPWPLHGSALPSHRNAL